jgi:DNA-binding CsgD family transcriptional regulator
MTLKELVARVRLTRTTEALWQTMLAYFRSCGAEMISYRHIHGDPDAEEAPTIFQEGFPQAFVDRFYAEELFRGNPVVAHALKTTKPIFWKDAGRLADLSPENRAFMRELQSVLPGEGLLIQVFGPLQRNGTVNIGFGEVAPRHEPSKVREIQLAAQSGHLHYCELVPVDPDRDKVLTAREREVLEWISKGKSNSVIAEILGISVHTVDTHVRRIFRKLEVNDRTTAAVKGLGAGLLQAAA